ncbi:MAG: TatD family hydrolase [Bacteroidales bacterium]|jgi:TatD DNase family protein|nr:TatD family hydrolase [Bacteroidales bacterium]
MYIDTHAHLYRTYYPDDLEKVVQRAIAADVQRVIMPCVTASNMAELFEVQEKFSEYIFPLAGLHPTEVKQETYQEELDTLFSYLQDSRVVGVGECGIDLYHDKETLLAQQDAFQQQLTWARDFNLPLSLHVRNAYNETIAILNNFRSARLKGVMHCFSGGIQEARWAVEYGLFLGIGGVITFKNNQLQNIVKEIGIDHLVLETDAPFLAPVPYRGKTNESAYIPLIAEKIAAIFNLSVNDVMQITTNNALSIFNIA